MRIKCVVARCTLFAGLTLAPATLLQVLAPSALAQSASGKLSGTVRDASGAAVPKVSVTATNEATGVKSTTVANGEGEYIIQNLLPGAYDVSTTAPGFATTTVKAVAVKVDFTATQDLALRVSSSNATVEVSSAAGVTLDTTTENLTTTFESQELAMLPVAAVGNGVLNVSLLAPNVSSPGGVGIGTGPSVGGQRPRNNNYTIEGIDDNDKSVTGPLIEIPNDAVGEFTFITSQFSPEFGHSSGGQFNTTVLSGTNHFHGKVYEYFQNRNLNAASGIAGGKVPNPRFDFNRYGGQVGGPIVHDKLFFFANFERSTTGQTLSGYICTPTAAGIAQLNSLIGPDNLSATNVQQYLKYTPPATVGGGGQVSSDGSTPGGVDHACFNDTGAQYLPVSADGLTYDNGSSPITQIPMGNALVQPPDFTNTDQLTTSVDFTPSQNNNFRFRYTYLTSASIDTTNLLSPFFTNLPLKEHLLAFSYFHTFTPNLINEARIGYNRLFQNFPPPAQSFPGLNQFPNLIMYDAGIDIGGDDNAPQSSIQNLYQLTDNVSYIHGKHNFVVGFDGRKYISPQNFVQRQRGDYEWNGLDPYLHDLAPDAFGERSAGAQNYAGDQTAFYGYGNDTYRATHSLTLNIGLRYEFTSVPSGERKQALNSLASVPGLISFHAPQPAYKNFAPRLGIAYAVKDTTSIRAGFGMAYDVLFDNLGLLTSPPELSQTHDVGNPAPHSTLTASGDPIYLSPNFLANGGLSNVLVPITSPTVARNRTAAYLPDQTLPYSINYNLTIQHVFAKNYTAEIQYLGTRGIHLPTQNQINVHPEVTAANQLTTYYSGPTVDASGAFATFATAPNANTLGNISAQNPTSYYVPAFYNAGFVSKITGYVPYGGSNYNGLGLNVTRRFINGLQANVSYTYSRAMDDSDAEVNASALSERRPQNSQDQHAEYSRSAMDHPQRLTAEAVWDMPYFHHSNWLLRNALGGWQLAPIYTYESPEYVTATSNVNSNMNGDSGAISRTLINPTGNKALGSGVIPVYSTTISCPAPSDGSPTPATCNGNLVGYLATNPSAYYVVAGKGVLPNQERNTVAGRPIDNLTLTAGKRISFGERFSFDFQAQAFNVFNHAQYVPGNIDDIGGTSSTSSSSGILHYLTPGQPTFNQPQTAYSNHARSMQLVAKFNF